MRDALHFANWTESVALLAFLVSFAVFLVILLGITRLPAARLKRLEEFPLEQETITSHEHTKR